VRKLYLFALTGALLALATSSASAQRRVTGRVTSNTGQPLSGAAVTVQGTPFTAYSGDDGRFTIADAGEGAKVLVARHIGYKRTTVPLPAGQNEINIQIEKDVLELERVVITGAATSVSSANAAQSVTQLSAEQIVKAPTPMLENALQGKIPGALVTTNSGAPGGGSQIQIRGTTSINANAQPLYVVDGVLVSNAQVAIGLNSVTNAGGGINSSQDQMVNRIADINPDDIESLEVLKGSSAGALYGSKAAAGVVVITTKRGQGGRANVNFTQRVGQFSLGKTIGLRCFGSQAEAIAWYGSASLPSPWQPVCHDFEKEYYGGNDMSYESNLSVRGGTAAGGTTYYLGGLAKRDNAIAKNSYYQKQNLTANIGQLIGSKVNVRVNNAFSHSLTDRGIHGNDNSPIVSPGDVFSGTPTFFDLSSGARNPWLAEGTNPFQTAQKLKAPEDVFRYIGSVHATWSAYSSTKQSFDLNFLGGVDSYRDAGRIISPADLYFEPADGLPGSVIRSDAASTFSNLNANGVHKYVASGYGTATTSFGLRKERRDFNQMLNQSKNVPAGAENTGLGANVAISETITLVKDFGYFVQEELLGLDDRLFLTAAVNSERSSVNGADDKFYAYPKYAASYRLPWLPPLTDELKLRVAYGKAGNQPPYGYKFTALATGVNDGLLGARPSTIAGNPTIKPETSNETEGGFDAQFWGGRAAFGATYFTKKVTDLILSATVAPTTGFSTKYVNGGTLLNKGTELSLDVTPWDRNGIQWLSRTTFYQVRGKITQLNVAPFTPGVGSFGTRFGSPWIENGRSPTVIRVVDDCITGANPAGVPGSGLNAAGVCPAANRVNRYKESLPDYTMGFSNTFTWNQFSAYGLVDWRKGGLAANLTNNYFDASGTLADTALSTKRLKDFGAGKGVYVEDAGFVKLREITLAYRLPQSLLARYFGVAKDVRVELSGRNLLTSTKYTGYDPEVSNFSNQNLGRFQDVTPYPSSRSFFFSVGANF
jgi:TonB-linked SusC/RagA family outer membrane protein